MDGRASATARVVKAVAAAEDRDPIDLPPLNDAIETDALDALFDTGPGAEASPLELCFCYSDSVVTVHGDGTIDVDPRRPEFVATKFGTRTE